MHQGLTDGHHCQPHLVSRMTRLIRALSGLVVLSRSVTSLLGRGTACGVIPRRGVELAHCHGWIKTIPSEMSRLTTIVTIPSYKLHALSLGMWVPLGVRVYLLVTEHQYVSSSST